MNALSRTRLLDPECCSAILLVWPRQWKVCGRGNDATNSETVSERYQCDDVNGGPGRTRTYNQQIMRLETPAESKGFIDPSSAKRGKVQQNTQTGRKRGGGK
jgi:hypothetical protein